MVFIRDLEIVFHFRSTKAGLSIIMLRYGAGGGIRTRDQTGFNEPLQPAALDRSATPALMYRESWLGFKAQPLNQYLGILEHISITSPPHWRERLSVANPVLA